MKRTNIHNLPAIIVRAVERNNQLYSKGPVARSVTQLINAPQVDALRAHHYEELERDVSDEWWALFGSAVHAILELGAGPNDIVEERLYARIDGWDISGKIDVQIADKDGNVSLEDYKVTSAYVVGKEKYEWETQLNLCAYLVWKCKNVKVTQLSIIAIIRDWQRFKATEENYPVAPIIRIPIPLWDIEKQEAYAVQRVQLHRKAAMSLDLDQPLPECTAEDRWVRDDVWAALKEGNVRATKVFTNQDDAVAFAEKNPAIYLEHRAGEPVRCTGNYCSISQFCQQWAKEKHLYEKEK